MGALNSLEATGRFTKGMLAGVGRLGFFTTTLASWIVASRPYTEGVFEAAFAIGLRTVAILCAVLFFIGANVSLVGYTNFAHFGGQNMTGIYVGLSCVIGLAPLIVGAMLGAKPGTEIASTIASMRVREQIDALEVMAVNPFWFLIVPRVLAYLIVTPPLVVFAYFASVAGGYVAGVFQLGLNPGTFYADLIRYLNVWDLWKGIFRAEIFAIVVCLISCYNGYYSQPGPAGVSRAINLSVVIGSTAIIIINYFLTELMY
jgi:phospholipid/cholesterol/gamma-HCH transport system permease protein